jgi:transcription initiation factor TFIID subunit 13
VRQLLYAHGDDQDPLEETVKVLDDIVTDYIVEACHGAARIATIAGRQKVKVDDFRVVFRKDAIKLGRMLDLDKTAKEQKEQRKMFDPNDDRVEKAGFAFAEALGDLDTDEEDTTATAAAAGVAGGAEDAAVGKKRKRGKGDDTDGKAKGKKKVKEV